MSTENTRVMTLQLTVEVPARTAESEVENAVNEALNEPPCDWGNWTVSGVSITSVVRSTREE